MILSSWASGNTFGATRWTDGKMDAPMLPDESWLMKSPSENILFWTDEGTEVAQIDVYHQGKVIPEEWKEAVDAEEPEKGDFYRALEEGMGSTKEKFLYLRRSIWWADNDPFRYGETEEVPVHDKRNLEQILPFLHEYIPEDLLCAAEIHRELSRFEECLKLLNRSIPDEFTPYSDLIKKRALAGNPALARLPQTGEEILVD